MQRLVSKQQVLAVVLRLLCKLSTVGTRYTNEGRRSRDRDGDGEVEEGQTVWIRCASGSRREGEKSRRN